MSSVADQGEEAPDTLTIYHAVQELEMKVGGTFSGNLDANPSVYTCFEPTFR